jgi:DNA polymerase-1
MSKVVLIDGDTVAYRCAASILPSKKKPDADPPELAIRRADELMFRILNTCQSTEYKLYISGSENFRYELYGDYKANRVGKERPIMLEPVKEFLLSEWEGILTHGYEADDAISIQASMENAVDNEPGRSEYIIAANDKDFLQLPGEHYNFVTDAFQMVSEDEALWNFWNQVLTGDYSDNVPGLSRVGPARAAKILSGHSPRDYAEVVRNAYNDARQFSRTYHLIRLLRSEEEYEDLKRKIERKEFTEEGA